MGKQRETVTDFTADRDCSHEIKRRLLLGREAMTNLDCVLKSRCYFSDKGPYSRSYGFASSHVWMWELDHKESWAQKNWCFWTVVPEKTHESPSDCKEIKPVIPKEMSPEYSLEGLMLKLQYFGHLMWKADSFEKTLMLGKIEDKRRRGQQRMRTLNGITNSMDMSLSKLQEIVRTGNPGVLQFMGLQRVIHNLSDWTMRRKTHKGTIQAALHA